MSVLECKHELERQIHEMVKANSSASSKKERGKKNVSLIRQLSREEVIYLMSTYKNINKVLSVGLCMTPNNHLYDTFREQSKSYGLPEKWVRAEIIKVYGNKPAEPVRTTVIQDSKSSTVPIKQTKAKQEPNKKGFSLFNLFKKEKPIEESSTISALPMNLLVKLISSGKVSYNEGDDTFTIKSSDIFDVLQAVQS